MMHVMGIDEAGRGPLAGPVVVAAVVLPEDFHDDDLRDSKKMTRPARERLNERIRAEAIAWAIEYAHPEEIDRLNILWATMAAMTRAAHQIPLEVSEILVDGNRVPDGLREKGRAVIGGDDLHLCISAASVLAKTERDAYMVRLAETHPEYGFELHFGYPTPEHKQALKEHGPCPAHRRSFSLGLEEATQLCLALDL